MSKMGHSRSGEPASQLGYVRCTLVQLENQTTLKISRKSIFGLHCCCVALQRHYGGP